MKADLIIGICAFAGALCCLFTLVALDVLNGDGYRLFFTFLGGFNLANGIQLIDKYVNYKKKI